MIDAACRPGESVQVFHIRGRSLATYRCEDVGTLDELHWRVATAEDVREASTAAYEAGGREAQDRDSNIATLGAIAAVLLVVILLATFAAKRK